MYNDFYLRFADEAEANGVLFDGEAPRYTAIDVIGTIYKPTGNMLTTDEGPVDEMAPIPGWHVNVRHMGEALELAPFQVYPATPVRMWA